MTTSELPADWKTIPLRRLLESAQSGFASGARDPNGVIQIRMNNVTTDGNLNWTSFIRVPATQKQLDKYHLRAGDVLFNNTNSPDLVGKTTVFDGHAEPVVFSNHFIRLRVAETKIDPWYLARWLTKQWQQRVFENLCTKWVNQASVRKDDLLSLAIPLPPLPEQKRITGILERADRLRRLRRYARELSAGYLQSVFLAMFGDPVTNPRGWKVPTIQEIAIKVTDGEHTTPKRIASGIKLLSARNIQNGYLDFEAGLDYIPEYEYKRIKKRCDPKFGDVLMSCSGTIGRVTTVNIEEPFSMVRSVALIKPDHSKVNSKYLEHYLRSNHGQRLIHRSVNQSSQANIFITPIKELPVLVPPLPLQRQFAGIVHKFERLRAQQREAERQAEHLFQTLLQRAFLGEL